MSKNSKPDTLFGQMVSTADDRVSVLVTRSQTISVADDRVPELGALFDHSISDDLISRGSCLEPDTLIDHSISDNLNSRRSCVGTRHSFWSLRSQTTVCRNRILFLVTRSQTIASRNRTLFFGSMLISLASMINNFIQALEQKK